MQPLLLQILIFLKKAGIMLNGLCMPCLIVLVIILLFVIFISFRFIVFVVINTREEVFRQRIIKFVELLIEVVLLLPCGDIPLHIPLKGVKDTLAHVYIVLCALCAEPPFPQYILNIVEIKQLHVQKLVYAVSV